MNRGFFFWQGHNITNEPGIGVILARYISNGCFRPYVNIKWNVTLTFKPRVVSGQICGLANFNFKTFCQVS